MENFLGSEKRIMGEKICNVTQESVDMRFFVAFRANSDGASSQTSTVTEPVTL